MIEHLQVGLASNYYDRAQWRPDLRDGYCIEVHEIMLDLNMPSQDNTTSDGFAIVTDVPIAVAGDLYVAYDEALTRWRGHVLAYTHQRTSARGTSGWYGDFPRISHYGFHDGHRCLMMTLGVKATGAGMFLLATARVDYSVVRPSAGEYALLLARNSWLVSARTPNSIGWPA